MFSLILCVCRHLSRVNRKRYNNRKQRCMGMRGKKKTTLTGKFLKLIYNKTKKGVPSLEFFTTP
jgi:hypothetical protein